MLHKGIFNLQKCTKHEWCTGKDRRSQLGRGQILWIKTVTTDPCILLGDVNASIPGGRTKYAPPSDDNPTTIADQTFANFVETTKGTIVPPAQGSWEKPFDGIKGKEAKFDFAVVYNLDEDVTDGYTDWISPLHDHTRVSLAIGNFIRGDIPIPKPVSHPKEKKIQTRLKLEDIMPHLPFVDEICTPLSEQILGDHKRGDIISSDGVDLLLNTRMTTLLQNQPDQTTKKTKIKLMAYRNTEQRESKVHIMSSKRP
jgi:hypothetical protein